MNENIDFLVHPDLGFWLLEAKQRFERLFLFRESGRVFIFRPLTVGECESIYSLARYIDSYVVDEWVVTKTILSHNLSYLLNDVPAGLASSLSSSVIKNSTVDNAEQIAAILEEEREKKTSIAGVLDSMVKLGAGYLLKDTKAITYRQQIKYVAFSEDVLGKKLDLVKPTSLPKSAAGKRLSPEVSRILSKESADKPDFVKDNHAFKSI